MKGITVDKLRKRLYQVSVGLELIIALVAVVGVVIAAVNLFPELLVYWQNRTNGEAFLIFLDAVFDVVIGVEFLLFAFLNMNESLLAEKIILFW